MGISIDEKLSLKSIVNFDRYPIDRLEFADNCKKSIDSNGCIVLPNFLIKEVIDELIKESLENQHKAFYCEQQHNVYITP